jgi:hypothetical protein
MNVFMCILLGAILARFIYDLFFDKSAVMEVHRENEEKKRGGFREGSGRKPTGRLKQFANTTISGTPEEIELLKSKAKEAGKTVSRFVIEKILSE